ncbi:MAG: DUF5662 family protein [Agathobacter rectalis]
MSKYSPTEFLSAAGITRYMSPNNAERADRGYSSAWLHHKGRNKHHLEYWIDYAVSKPGTIKHIQNGGHENAHKVCLRDVYRPCKRLKNYQKEKYTDKSALEYYEKAWITT